MMKQENSIIVFIFLLIANLYLYLISGVSSIKLVSTYGPIASTIIFSLVLFGLYMASVRSEFKNPLLYFYYFGLFLVSLLVLLFELLSIDVDTIIQYYFGLAILIALFLSIADYRSAVINRAKTIMKYRMEARQMNQEISHLHSDIQEKEEEIKKKDAKSKQVAKQLEAYQGQAETIKKELDSSEGYIAGLNSRIQELRGRNKRLSKGKKSVAELKSNQEKLEREVRRSKKEMKRQSDLKRQYSRTLRHIRQKKKEEQELLVVSADGSSVHRPGCIIVRNVPKDSRKLIKNWKEAKKEGYTGCGLCNPHIKPKVIIKDYVKYMFITSKESDKVHKASCTLVKKITRKDREYFRTYRAALKKGYTACRVCNPEQ